MQDIFRNRPLDRFAALIIVALSHYAQSYEDIGWAQSSWREYWRTLLSRRLLQGPGALSQVDTEVETNPPHPGNP